MILFRGMLPVGKRSSLDQTLDGERSDDETGTFLMLSQRTKFEHDQIREQRLFCHDLVHGTLDVRPQRMDAESLGKTCVNVRVVRSGVDHNGDPRPLAPFCDQLTGEGLD